MKFYDNDDELERALFAVPLEEPPAGLRASILNATVYRPAAMPASTKPWELWAAGAALAVVVWLCIAMAQGSGTYAVSTLDSAGGTVVAFFAQRALLFWIAIGSAIAVWLSQANFILVPGYQRSARR